MRKLLLNVLVIGGVSMLSLAPQFLQAEDGSSNEQNGSKARMFTNVNDVEAPVLPRSGASPQNQKQAESFKTEQGQNPDQYRSLVETISRNNGVDPNLIDAMMKTESNYDRWAVSSKGAKGLMQLIPETGRRFGVQDFFDPRQNIEGGVRYVRFLLDMFHGNVDLSLAAYNAGENLVARLGRIPPIPETRNYVRKIRAVYTNPVTTTVSSGVTIGPARNQAPIVQSTMESPDATNAQEPSSTPISKWVDQRGVRHFSNVSPLD